MYHHWLFRELPIFQQMSATITSRMLLLNLKYATQLNPMQATLQWLPAVHAKGRPGTANQIPRIRVERAQVAVFQPIKATSAKVKNYKNNNLRILVEYPNCYLPIGACQKMESCKKLRKVKIWSNIFALS